MSCTSVRRRLRRLALGANKKIKAYSAENQLTVGVMRLGLGNQFRGSGKASKGVEKSFRPRRRKRGLRRGRFRSRGRHPRGSSTPANVSTHHNRVVRHHIRMADWASAVASTIRSKVLDLRDDEYSSVQSRGSVYGRLLRSYRAAKGRVARRANSALADSVLGLNLVDYLESGGMRIWPRPLRDGFTPTRDQGVSSLLQLLRGNLHVTDVETNRRRPVRPRLNGRTRRGEVRRPMGPFCVRCGEVREATSPHGRVCVSCYNVEHGIPPPYRP